MLSFISQDVENSRSYIDDLYTNDDSAKVQESLICLKNVVIGSDRQKNMVISQGIVPRLMAILNEPNAPLNLRYDAAIVLGSFILILFIFSSINSKIIFSLGSLSKGSEENVRALIDAELIQLLLTTITNPNSDKFLVEICLCVIRSMYEHPFAPSELISTNPTTLVYLIGKTKFILLYNN